MRFMCKVGVESAHDGYRAKNILPLGGVITPDQTKEWRTIEQQPKPKDSGPSGNAPTPITKPKWAS